MATRRVFTWKKNFSKLEELLLLANEVNGAKNNLVLLPPNLGVLSDAEEEENDDLPPTTLTRDVIHSIEIHPSHPDHDFSDCNDSDDEPFSSFSRPSKRMKNKDTQRCSTTHNVNDAIQSRQKNIAQSMKDHNPVMLFEKFFDNDVMDLITENSILYAEQNNEHNFQMTHEDLKNFLGILMLTGYHKLPTECAYWSLDEDLCVPLVANCMSRNRFLEIKRNLHFADNSLVEFSYDKMFKVRPLIDLIQRNSCQWGVFHENLSIGESIIEHFSCYSVKKFIAGERVRFGYRNWAATSSDGYCYTFDVYCGESPSQASTDLRGTTVVKSLLANMPIIPKEHNVYFNVRLTNYQLLYDLQLLGFKATGIVKENENSDVKVMRRPPRKRYDCRRIDKEKKITILHWHDNDLTIGTNFDSVEPLGKMKRWCSARKEILELKIPRLFINYIRGIDGINQMDQSINKYRVSARGKKWWWIIFNHVLNVAISNAWRLHVLLCQTEEVTHMDQLLFRRTIAREYIRQTKTKSSLTSQQCLD